MSLTGDRLATISTIALRLFVGGFELSGSRTDRSLKPRSSRLDIELRLKVWWSGLGIDPEWDFRPGKNNVKIGKLG